MRIILDEGWIKAQRLLSVNAAIMDTAIDRTLGQEAAFYERKIKQGITRQHPEGGEKFKPLSPLTIAIRQFTGIAGTKALSVRGDLRNSIKAVRLNNKTHFVGVLRTARGRSSSKLVNIAEVHEFGSKPIVLVVTKKMRGFLAAAFTAAFGGVSQGKGGFSTGIIVTKIPPRPFIKPIFDKYGAPAVVKRRFLWRLSRNLTKMGHLAPPSQR